MQEKGRKYDGGKLRYDLIPVLALEEVTRVITLGAEKYDPENWKNVPEGRRRYTAAAFRHIEAWRKGEVTDEIGTHHIANAISNLMFILEKELRGWEDVEEGNELVEIECDTCGGEGSYDNRDYGIPREHYNANCPCPDCDGTGSVTTSFKDHVHHGMVIQGSSIKPSDEGAKITPWYPDSGEWIEYDGSGQPVEDDVRVEVLLADEREARASGTPCSNVACNWCWDWSKGWYANKIVAYKIVN